MESCAIQYNQHKGCTVLGTTGLYTNSYSFNNCCNKLNFVASYYFFYLINIDN